MPTVSTLRTIIQIGEIDKESRDNLSEKSKGRFQRKIHPLVKEKQTVLGEKINNSTIRNRTDGKKVRKTWKNYSPS